MKVELLESVDDFIAASVNLRAAEPLRTNVIGSVSLSVSKGERTYDECRWWLVRDDGDVVGVAMRTSPFKMTLSPMPEEAARELGREVGNRDDHLPGITGSSRVIDALVEGYVESKSPGSSRRLVEERRDLLYELEELVTPEANGVGRPGRVEELEELATMVAAFSADIGHPRLSLAEARDNVAVSLRHGSIFCWEIDDAVVSIAGHAPVVVTGDVLIGRVGPVYTPPDLRGRGFASAVTAHVSRHLLEKGARVMLFTDAANPTSNSIYQKIGYRLVDELVETRFE